MEKKMSTSEDIVSQLTQEVVGTVELSNDELQAVAGGYVIVPPTSLITGQPFC